MKVSNCCGAKVKYLQDDNTGMCDECHDHCDAEEQEEHENNLMGDEYGY